MVDVTLYNKMRGKTYKVIDYSSLQFYIVKNILNFGELVRLHVFDEKQITENNSSSFER